MLAVRQFPCLTDNYGFLARDEATGLVATIDTPLRYRSRPGALLVLAPPPPPAKPS